MNTQEELTELARLMRLAEIVANTDEADSALLDEALTALDGAKHIWNNLGHEMNRIRTATRVRQEIKLSQAWAARNAKKVGA